MSQFTFTIIFLAFLTAAFFAWYFTHKAREKERLLLIEKGLELPESNQNRKFSFKFPWLKIGSVVTGLASGLLIGMLVSYYTGLRGGVEPVFMFLFGGIGMIIAHYVDNKDN